MTASMRSFSLDGDSKNEHRSGRPRRTLYAEMANPEMGSLGSEKQSLSQRLGRHFTDGSGTGRQGQDSSRSRSPPHDQRGDGRNRRSWSNPFGSGFRGLGGSSVDSRSNSASGSNGPEREGYWEVPSLVGDSGGGGGGWLSSSGGAAHNPDRVELMVPRADLVAEDALAACVHQVPVHQVICALPPCSPVSRSPLFLWCLFDL